MSGQVFLDTSPCLRIANMIREEINEILARYDVHSDAHERDELIDAACVQLADKALVIAASAHKPSDTSGQITGDKDCASVVGGPHSEWECPIGRTDCHQNCGNYGCGN